MTSFSPPLFFILSAVYAAPYVGATAGNIFAVVTAALGWYALWKEEKLK